MPSKRYTRECMDNRKELKTAKEVLNRIESGCKSACKDCNPEERLKAKKECDETIDIFKKNLEKENAKFIDKGCDM